VLEKLANDVYAVFGTFPGTVDSLRHPLAECTVVIDHRITDFGEWKSPQTAHCIVGGDLAGTNGIDESGELEGAVYGPVGSSLPQPSPSAEHLAVLAAAAAAPPRAITEIITDYQGILDVYNHQQYFRKHKYAGVAMLTRGSRG
jgi:hypothetical protein